MRVDRRSGQDEEVFPEYPVAGVPALTVGDEGAYRVDLYRSKPDGDVVHLRGKQLETGADPVEVEFRVSLAPFEDGGWVWFDVADAPWALSAVSLHLRRSPRTDLPDAWHAAFGPESRHGDITPLSDPS